MNNGGFINHDNQENYIIDDEEESESIAYYEFGAHFKYKDLFNSLLKLKIEREKETMVMKVKVIKLLIIIFL